MTKNHYNKIIGLLGELKKKYPSQNMGRHLSLALSDYRDLWGAPDSEILFALEKYKSELELDYVVDPQLDRIIDEGMNLDKIFDDEFEQEDY